MIKTGLGFYCAAINQLYYLKSKVVSENVTISRFVVFGMEREVNVFSLLYRIADSIGLSFYSNASKALH